MINNQINWNRVRKALIQKEKQLKTKGVIESNFSNLVELIKICGEFSQNRKMVIKIGNKLLFIENPVIVIPCCPDYSHQNGYYTFRGLNGGVSLLTLKHIEFMKKVSQLFPKIRPLFIIADAEVNDVEILRAVGKDEKEFLELVESSLLETRKTILLNWQVQFMTTVIPDLIERELLVSKQIRENKKYSQRIITEMHSRVDMYRKINSRFKVDQMMERTIRTASQYVALGEYIHQQGYLICNHTTTSLSWYLQTEAPVIHNSISIY